MNLCIIQARSGSTRLPGKSLMKINGKTLVRHVYDNIRKVGVWAVVVAIPSGDKEMIGLCKADNIPYYEGPEGDVLARYYHCAVAYGATRIMRLTADCPAIPIETMMMATQFRGDFISNAFHPRTYPDGWDVEVMSFAVLKWMHLKATGKEDREHVTRYFYTNAESAGKITVARMDLPLKLGHLKYSIDTEGDLEVVRRLMGEHDE